eukprot:scaffold14295_cov116-Isochrysis_galbana.AAC.2
MAAFRRADSPCSGTTCAGATAPTARVSSPTGAKRKSSGYSSQASEGPLAPPAQFLPAAPPPLSNRAAPSEAPISPEPQESHALALPHVPAASPPRAALPRAYHAPSRHALDSPEVSEDRSGAPVSPASPVSRLGCQAVQSGAATGHRRVWASALGHGIRAPRPGRECCRLEQRRQKTAGRAPQPAGTEAVRAQYSSEWARPIRPAKAPCSAFSGRAWPEGVTRERFAAWCPGGRERAADGPPPKRPAQACPAARAHGRPPRAHRASPASFEARRAMGFGQT